MTVLHISECPCSRFLFLYLSITGWDPLPIFILLGFLFLLICRSSLYILETDSLLISDIVNIFSHSLLVITSLIPNINVSKLGFFEQVSLILSNQIQYVLGFTALVFKILRTLSLTLGQKMVSHTVFYEFYHCIFRTLFCTHLQFILMWGVTSGSSFIFPYNARISKLFLRRTTQ